MSYPNSWELWCELNLRLQRGDSIEGLQEPLYRCAESALARNNLYDALKAYRILEDTEMVRHVGEQCIERGWGVDAYSAFSYLDDIEGVRRAIRTVEDMEGAASAVLENLVASEFSDDDTGARVSALFERWVSHKGKPDTYTMGPLTSIAKMAYALSGEYDLGIGVARGGVFSSYIFGLFGLDVKIADCHREEQSTSFYWLDEVQKEDVEGKSVVVFDKDVRSGRTSERVLSELQAYEPCNVDLVLDRDAASTKYSAIGTMTSAIPQGYDNAYTPCDVSYAHIDEAMRTLRRALPE